MILPILQEIATENELVFHYGEQEAFEELVDALQDGQIALYHQGYIGGPVKPDMQGLWETSYLLRLSLFLPSQVGNHPHLRRPLFEKLEPIMTKLLGRLSKTHELTNGFLQEGINLYHRNLDGITVSLNAKPKFVEGTLQC